MATAKKMMINKKEGDPIPEIWSKHGKLHNYDTNAQMTKGKIETKTNIPVTAMQRWDQTKINNESGKTKPDQ